MRFAIIRPRTAFGTTAIDDEGSKGKGVLSDDKVPGMIKYDGTLPSDPRRSKDGELTYDVGRRNMRDEDTEKMTLRLPARYLKALDFLVEVDDFPSRSEAVRAAIRDFVYARVELVADKLKKMKDAERTLAEAESLKREYMNR